MRLSAYSKKYGNYRDNSQVNILRGPSLGPLSVGEGGTLGAETLTLPARLFLSCKDDLFSKALWSHTSCYYHAINELFGRLIHPSNARLLSTNYRPDAQLLEALNCCFQEICVLSFQNL